MEWWYGFKLHVQCDEVGRLCAFALTTATVDDRKLLDPLTRWLKEGIVIGDGGYLSQAKARDLAQRGGICSRPPARICATSLLTFSLVCLQLRLRVKELLAFLKCSFGAVRTTRRVARALPVRLLGCLPVYSLYKSLIT